MVAVKDQIAQQADWSFWAEFNEQEYKFRWAVRQLQPAQQTTWSELTHPLMSQLFEGYLGLIGPSIWNDLASSGNYTDKRARTRT